MDIYELRKRLSSIGQDQVLRYYSDLDEAGQKKLGSQIAALDLAAIAELAETYVRNKPLINLPRDIQPVSALPRVADSAHQAQYDKARKRGEELLRDGKVAALLVAGGQGTRLGYDGPKGEFPVTPIKQKPLFQVFAEQLLALGIGYGKQVPWYIMTSDINDAPTREFFTSHRHFGLDPSNVVFFEQGMMPAFDTSGKLLLSAKDSLALSPDGHGGSLRAVDRSGALADMKKRGIEHFSYFQVDNPMVHVVDPLFIGLHDLTGSEMSSKTITKANALEKVGNFVMGDGVLQVIEYSDLPSELAQQVAPDGKPKFNAASIGIHALRVSFVERLNQSGRLQLPWHRADKKVAYVDEHGNEIKPDKPNAVKLEQFVFDAIPLAKNAIVYTTDRGEEFSPVKNADGVDSPATCRRDQIRRAARWLKEAGVSVPMKDAEPNAVIEISPLYALSGSDIAQRGNPPTVDPGQSLLLER